MLDAIITQLKNAQLNGKPLFGKVESAIDLVNAMDGAVKPSPVAYVIEISRRPGSNQRDMGRAMQKIQTTIGVVIGISKTNDPQGTKAKAAVDPILKQARESLFGFAPTVNCSPMLLGAADPVGVNKHALWQLERFTTEHFEEAKQ